MQANKLKTLVAAVALATPLMAQADSGVAIGPGNISTTADLSFRITIPRFVFLRVGSAGTTVNELLYTPTPAQIATPTPVTAASGGDVSGTDVTFQAFGNAGNLTLASSALALAGPSTMANTTLTGVAQTGTIAPPAWNSSTPLPAVSNVVNEAGTWRFSWQATASTLYADGDYTGTAVFTLSNP